MMTGLRSDLPGQAIAQVTQPVFDTPTGAILLIPQGARLIGKYDARLAFAQRRIPLTWTRLILPNGKSLDLDALPAGDAAGQAGLEDKVDHRWGTLLGTAALSTLLSIGAEIGADDDDDLVRAIRRGAIDTFNQAGQLAVEKGLSTPPIITIRPVGPRRGRLSAGSADKRPSCSKAPDGSHACRRGSLECRAAKKTPRGLS